MQAAEQLRRSFKRPLAVVGALLLVSSGVACTEAPLRPGKFTKGNGKGNAKIESPEADAADAGALPEDAGFAADSNAASSQGGHPSTDPEGDDASDPPPPEEPPPPPEEPIEPQLPQGSASWPIQSGDAVFFVGNSFMGGDNSRLADLVPALGTAVSPPLAIRTGQHVVYGNYPLSWFFQQPESQNAIASGEYDVFVIQGEDREPVDRPEAFKQAVRDYHNAVTAHGGRIMLYMTWDFYWERNTDFFARLSAAYEGLGQELNVPVIPIGLIYEDCDEQPYAGYAPDSYWLTNQQLHQNDMGTAVNTYATFAMLTGINPQGALFVAPWINTMPPELLMYLSDMSWARVRPRLGL